MIVLYSENFSVWRNLATYENIMFRLLDVDYTELYPQSAPILPLLPP
jgi:hypothetical protein